MRRVFLDTNIVIDLIQRRNGFEMAARIMQDSVEGKYEVVTSTLSMVNVAYVLRKVFKGENLYEMLTRLRRVIGVVPVSASAYDKAISSKGKDFEDAVQLYSALEADADCVVTRNARDFMSGLLPIYDYTTFLETY